VNGKPPFGKVNYLTLDLNIEKIVGFLYHKVLLSFRFLVVQMYNRAVKVPEA